MQGVRLTRRGSRCRSTKLDPYEVRLTPPARRQLRKLPTKTGDRVRVALRKQARASGGATGQRGGKSVKQIRGRRDRFFRLRVGDYRVMYDVSPEERVLLVLGIVNRRDLEKWLRGR